MVPAIAGAFLLAMRDPSTPAPAAAPPAASPAIEPAPIVNARFVCSFANDDAASAYVDGADGGQSVVVDGRTYWLFGDTLFAGASGKQIEANTIASSATVDAAGCPELTYHAQSGVAVPFLQKDGSLTVWPSGAVANDDGTFDVFTVYVYGSGPYAYWIGEVGLARVDPSNMSVQTRARTLFNAESGFRSQIIAAQPVDEDADHRLRVILQAQDGEKLLARTPRASIDDASAYEYWTGAAWSDDPAAATPLWPVTAPADPIAKLASFEGSVSVTWSDAFHSYVALTNAGSAAIGARFADRLEGPWSDVVPWIDCSAIAEPRVPVCYAPTLHPQLSRDGSLFVTFTRFGEYDVVAYELTPGLPVHEFRVDGHVIYAFAAPGAEVQGIGVAFHASPIPAPGLDAIYVWRRGDELAFAATSPGDGFVQGATAFYVSLHAPLDASPVELRPVYAWSDGATHMLSTMDAGLERYGFTRGDIAFYTPRRPPD
jgi:hypothetical protein